MSQSSHTLSRTQANPTDPGPRIKLPLRPPHQIRHFRVAVYDERKNLPVFSSLHLRQYLDLIRGETENGKCQVEIVILGLSGTGEWITTFLSNVYTFWQDEDGAYRHFDFNRHFTEQLEKLGEMDRKPVVDYSSTYVSKIFHQDGYLNIYIKDEGDEEDEEEGEEIIDDDPHQEGFYHSGGYLVRDSCFSREAQEGYLLEFQALVSQILFFLN